MSDAKKLKMISPIATILLVLLVSGTLLIMSGAGSTFAAFVEGESYGLTVTVEEGFTEGGDNDVSNLTPGDTKSSYLTVSNTGDGAFKYFFDIKKIGSRAGSYRGQAGKPLDRVLEMTVNRGEEELFKGLVSEFREQFGEKGRDMGVLNEGESQQLDISVHLSGPETGNEYQGADVTVQFKFRADPVKEEHKSPPSTSSSSPPLPPALTGTASLSVYKFYDADADGIWDDDEEQIEGWKVFVNGEEYATPIELELEPGEYTVIEEVVDGWVATTPTEVLVVLEEGDSANVFFGNYEETEQIVPPEEPGSPPGDSELIEEKEEEIPAEPPKTGEFPPVILYGAGLLLVLVGLALRRKALARTGGGKRAGWKG